MSVPKIICPFHAEETPSCALYLDEGRYHCYGGACGKSGPLSEIADFLDEEYKSNRPAKPRYKSDVIKAINDIERLPTAAHRGFILHTDAEGYYLIWPERNYYLKRYFDSEHAKGKYRGPSGVQRPPYVLRAEEDTAPWVIIEGEFNAKSVAEALPFINVCSPGGVTSFKLAHLSCIKPDLMKTSRIVLVADDDIPGVSALIKLRSELIQINPNAHLNSVLMPDDANSIWERQRRGAASVYQKAFCL